jgi:type IV pilus assembly protein PilY1
MPDEIHWQSNNTYNGYDYMFYSVPLEFYRSPDFNEMYYNPAVQYVPPPASPGAAITGANGSSVTDGTLGNAQFNNAWFNGYDLATRNDSGNYFSDTTGTVPRKVNLGTSFVQTDYTSRLFGLTNHPVLANTSTPSYNFKGFPINGKRVGSYSAYGSTANSCYWVEWYNGACGAGEFLPMNAEPAHYYRCPAAAWPTYPDPNPNLAVTANKFNASLCTKVVITSEAEKQNFANWYSYYRTRNYASKAGIGRAFEKLDSSVRLGWGLINKKDLSTVKDGDGKSVGTIIQGVRQFDQARKKEFLDWLYKVQTAGMTNSPVFVSQLPSDTTNRNYGGGTPLRRALDNAGRYYDRRDGANLGPWADNPANPGTVATEKAAACRKSFTILMTDGYWNIDGAITADIVNNNRDGKARSPFGDAYANTLADIAWYYWDKKLLPDTVANKVPKTPAPGTLGAVPPKYRNDAEHQHMTTFTIGLGVAGTIDKDKAFRAIHDSSVGTITWPNPDPVIPVNAAKIDDLLHAAVNGHGDFFSASNPDEFVAGMSSIINSVNSAQKASSGNIDASSSQVSAVSTDVFIYKTHFKPDDWRGELIAQKIDSRTGLQEEIWFASEKMPSPGARNIYTRNSSGGVSFVWNDNLGSAHKIALEGPGRLLDAQQVLDYVRGSNANEGSDPGKFRPRYRGGANRAPLGDSPHNAPLYAKYDSAGTIFLGANDGMLHAFDADNGTEQFAYIPSVLISKLSELTNGHGFYVDGEILVTTPTQTPGQYLLVGALGRGGKGLYGLDVSDPTAFRSSHVKWELNGQQACSGSNPDYLGNIIGSLAYAEVNGGPSVVFGNGYNSCSDKAALGIVNISTGSATFIKASDDLGNGLAAPFIRTDGTASTRSAYAGDLRGKMWKFGLLPLLDTSHNFFNPGTTDQPITAQPVAETLNTASDVKKTFVYFGTGRYLNTADRGTTAQQNIYGLVDENSSTTLVRDNLQQHTFGATGSVEGLTARTVVGTADITKKGWYISLIDEGERVVNAPIVVQTPRGDVVIFTTIVPPVGGDPCNPKGSGWLYVVNAQTGGALDFVFLDLNGDGKFDDKDTMEKGNGPPDPHDPGKNAGTPSAIKISDLLGGMPGQARMVNGRLVIPGQDTDDNSDFCTTLCDSPQSGKKGRVSWREIIK